MAQLERLKSAQSLSDLAKILQIKPSTLSYLLYYTAAEVKYTQFEIPKRFGGTRKISAPINKLKRVQKNLSVALQDCLLK